MSVFLEQSKACQSAGHLEPTTMSGDLHLVKGEQAAGLLVKSDFLEQWQALFECCEWSTSFQSPDFVVSWFEVYLQYSPIIVYESIDENKLSGLLILAKESCGDMVFAGTHHAEYKGWLESKKTNYNFFVRALAEVTSCVGEFSLDFSYIRDKCLVDILHKTCSSLVEIHTIPRDYKVLSEDNVLPSLKKKGNKSKFNRLARLGDIQFLRISSSEKFRSYLEACVDYHDVWQGAMNDCYPFYNDNCKVDFHVRLFEKSPQQLHVTVMLLDQHPIALHIGYVQDKEILYSINAHNPVFHKYSLGKLLLLRVTEKMLLEGFENFDLSPGSDGWKRNFASGRTEAYKVFIHKNSTQKRISLYQCKLRTLFKRNAAKVGVDITKCQALLRKLSRVSRSKLLKRAVSLLVQKTEFRVYQLHKDNYSDGIDRRFEFKRDDLGDLLQYQGVKGRSSKQQFLAEALRRLGNGEHLYTYAENEHLLCYGWLVDQQKKAYFSEVNQPYTYDVEGAVVYDFYVVEAARGRGMYTAIATRMLHDVFNVDFAEIAYVSWLSDNYASPKVFANKLGFEFVESLHNERKLWIKKQWKSRQFSPKNT